MFSAPWSAMSASVLRFICAVQFKKNFRRVFAALPMSPHCFRPRGGCGLPAVHSPSRTADFCKTGRGWLYPMLHPPFKIPISAIRHPPVPLAARRAFRRVPPAGTLLRHSLNGGLSADFRRMAERPLLQLKCRSLGPVEPLPEPRYPRAFHYRLLSFRTN